MQKIEVKSADGQTTIGSGTVGADGKFSLSLSPALTDKNIAKIYIIDSSGNRSEPTDIFGAKDTISKKYDHTFKDVFEEIFEKEYKEKFEKCGILNIRRGTSLCIKEIIWKIF